MVVCILRPGGWNKFRSCHDLRPWFGPRPTPNTPGMQPPYNSFAAEEAGRYRPHMGQRRWTSHVIGTRPIFFGALGAAFWSALRAFGLSWPIVIAGYLAFLVAYVALLRIAHRRERQFAESPETNAAAD